MNFASDQHEYEGSKSSIIGSEGGGETIGGTFWAQLLHYN